MIPDVARTTNAKTVAACSLAILIALYVVGAVSVPPGSLRHEVQTLPLWGPIVLGFQRRDAAKWAAVPCLLFWLTLMVCIWLFLLGWAQIVSGHFFPTEIGMTVVAGVSALVGLSACLRWRTKVSPGAAATIFLVFAALQVLAFRLSLLPYIARR